MQSSFLSCYSFSNNYHAGDRIAISRADSYQKIIISVFFVYGGTDFEPRYRSGVYVALDSYFAYLKKNRVNELELIAQDLGAKSFRITFKEHQKVIVKQTANTGLKAGRIQWDGSHELSGSDYSRVEIAAETQFSGHSQPKTPTLVYFQNESDIEKLIRMRMDQSNPIKSKDFCFQCSRTSGMTEKTAAKIDLVLHQMKCSGTATLSSEV